MCDECGFDPEVGTTYDLIRGAALASGEFKHVILGAEESTLTTRPSDSMWSIVEYIDHLALVFELATEAHVHFRVTGDWTDFKAPVFDASAVVPSSEHALSRLTAAEQFLRTALEPSDTQTDSTLRRVNHGRVHHTYDAARIRSALADGIAEMSGSVAQINTSSGGLPKTAVPTARIDASGVTTDSQATRNHHGAPFQALCLYATEIIEQFAAQGHPIAFGSTGENVTIRGVDWSKLRSGLEVQIGDVVARLTFPATPCAQNSPWFADGDFRRLSYDAYPAQSRWYARVVSGGSIHEGDQVTISSPTFH